MSRVGHDQLVAGAPNAKVALLRWQNIKYIKVKKKRTCLRQITERAVNRNRPMHRRKKSLAMYCKNWRRYEIRKYLTGIIKKFTINKKFNMELNNK